MERAIVAASTGGGDIQFAARMAVEAIDGETADIDEKLQLLSAAIRLLVAHIAFNDSRPVLGIDP